MGSFKVICENEIQLRFKCYLEEAPITSQAFLAALPFETEFYHAKVSGEEIWTQNGLELHIQQENATVFMNKGEIAIGPVHKRNKVSKCIGIMYGEGKLIDCGNIFGRVYEEDFKFLKELGKKFWLEGKKHLRFEQID